MIIWNHHFISLTDKIGWQWDYNEEIVLPAHNLLLDLYLTITFQHIYTDNCIVDKIVHSVKDKPMRMRHEWSTFLTMPESKYVDTGYEPMPLEEIKSIDIQMFFF